MAIAMDVYFLYRIETGETGSAAQELLLLKLVRPPSRNAVVPEGEAAEEALEEKRDAVLERYLLQTNGGSALLIGKMEGWPEGDDFYEDHGRFIIDFWLAPSEYGFPWVAMSQAPDEEAFWNIVKEDELLAGIRPVPPAKQVMALFLTETDFAL